MSEESEIMFTSNFARVKRLPDELRPVGIAIKPPWYWKGPNEFRLAPTSAMLSMELKHYNVGFRRILAKLDAHELHESLGENAVLLCWESPGVSCHRRMVAEWFETKLGIVVPEYGFAREECPPYRDLPPKQARSTKKRSRSRR